MSDPVINTQQDPPAEPAKPFHEQHATKLEYIAEGLLTQIDWGWSDVSDDDIDAVATAIMSTRCKLQGLMLGDNKITQLGAAKIANAMVQRAHDVPITTLGLGNNSIGLAGTEAIVEAMLTGRCPLTYLDLTGNQIGLEGARVIGNMLTHEKCKLRQLGIGNNDLGPDGAIVIADALKSGQCTQTLERLFMGDNKIGDVGGAAVSEALRSGECPLLILFISGDSGLTDAGIRNFSEAVADPNSIINSVYFGDAKPLTALSQRHLALNRVKTKWRAFCLGRHRRLGEDSSIRFLIVDVMETVLSLLKSQILANFPPK
eukprot:c14444_g1_i1.p1 GENE.c14444_g1_i1~~c14444_g1_i1.p1  ORF type:complete len:316 (+),score=70.75 c14444_g1_i1:43-990(+)